jgi:zinc protease
MKKSSSQLSLCLFAIALFISCSTTKSGVTAVEPIQEATEMVTEVTEEKPSFDIPYEKFTLDNGLEVILHEDHSDPIVAVASIIHVGSNREKPGRTGFAHFFEHMSFNDSENVPRGWNRKAIPEWGGTRNGATWTDGTIYYEVVPKDAFDKILWIDSDRLGYIIKTVTDEALEREKQVVKNEKRQRVDNQPYGYTQEIILSNLYPADHPYSWTVIGALPDLQAATLEDVSQFYADFYGASNASLVIAGDIDIEETKQKVEQWFGEIPRGNEVEAMAPRPAVLTENKSLYFEDDFAKLPELRLTFPTVEMYHEDSYPLQILGEVLSGSRKSILYKEIVENGKLAPNIGSFQRSAEIAGTFTIRVRANDGVDLDDVKQVIDDGLVTFDLESFDDTELVRIKTESETSVYSGVETILNKAYQLVYDNEFKGDPTYLIKGAEKIAAVTKEDVMRVFRKYILGKNYVMTSVVPKGSIDLAVSDSELATVWKEEIKSDVAEEEVSQGGEAVFEKTPTKFDRSEPPFGETPLFQMPDIWDGTLNNGMKAIGILNDEVPLVTFELTIDGGHYLDPIDKPGVANLLTDLLMEGTATKTAAELEEAIGLIGASIRASYANDEISISGRCLTKNFNDAIGIVEEILLEPNWNQENFEKIKGELKTRLKDNETRARSIGFANLSKLLYGEDHILSTSGFGSMETVDNITLNDLKELYAKMSPRQSTFHVVGAISQKDVIDRLSAFSPKWVKEENTEIPSYTVPGDDSYKGKIYFIDIPDSKQSTIYAGKMTIPSSEQDYQKIKFANEVLGGGISGKLAQVLRIEKGYTYGAGSFLRDSKEPSLFGLSTSVRANATLPSLQEIEKIFKNYGPEFSDTEKEITQNKIVKESTRTYESASAKLGLLRNISKFGRSKSYIEEDQQTLLSMEVEDFKEVIDKYMDVDDLVFVVVGDAATQLEEVNKFGRGDAILLDIYGNVITK